MNKIIVWLLLLLTIMILAVIGYTEKWFVLRESLILPFKSILSAGFGGILYLLRAVYVNKCVRKSWDKEWETWYYIRPFTSLLSGIASYIFLKAGVLVLNAEIEVSTSSYGFMAVAFIAGLNVDKFTSKLEDLAKAAWGVEKSRMNSKTDNDETTT
jgi:hypothetical protein